jgi:hypothetical protein
MRWFGLRQLLISSTTCTTSFDLRSTHPPDTPHYLRLAGLSLPRPSGAPQLSSPFILLSILPLCIHQLPRPRISYPPRKWLGAYKPRELHLVLVHLFLLPCQRLGSGFCIPVQMESSPHTPDPLTC